MTPPRPLYVTQRGQALLPRLQALKAEHRMLDGGRNGSVPEVNSVPGFQVLITIRAVRVAVSGCGLKNFT
jgi:hypothetical protein